MQAEGRHLGNAKGGMAWVSRATKPEFGLGGEAPTSPRGHQTKVFVKFHLPTPRTRPLRRQSLEGAPLCGGGARFNYQISQGPVAPSRPYCAFVTTETLVGPNNCRCVAWELKRSTFVGGGA